MSQTTPPAERFTPEPPPESTTPLWRKRWFWRLSLFLLAVGITAVVVQSQWHPFWQAKYKERIRSLLAEARLDDAAAECETAIAAYPVIPDFYFERAQVRREQKKYGEALADLEKVLKMNRTFGDGYAERARVYMKLRDFPKALADLAEARKWASENNDELLNEHAYVRALAKTELPEAMQDIDKALYLLSERTVMVKKGSPEALNASHRKATYLDTRGYLLHLMDQQEKALADMDTAVDLYEKWLQSRIAALPEDQLTHPVWLQLKKAIDESLGTLYHHRGLIHEKMGNAEKAKADFNRREALGFDPEKE